MLIKRVAVQIFLLLGSQNINFFSEESKLTPCHIHIHFPEGAIPKDGPSAGIAIATAVLSALTGQAVHRDVAMTGEITLRGRVLAIGGLREKTMGALRAGVHTVILPKENEKDLDEIDPLVRAQLHFVPTEHVDHVLDLVLIREREEKQLCTAGIGGSERCAVRQ